MRDVIDGFNHEVEWLRRQAFIEHGATAKPRQTADGGEIVFRTRKKGPSVHLAWSTPSDGVIPWSIRRVDANGVEEHLAEGPFPRKRLFVQGMSALSILSEKPPVHTIAPKGKAAAAIFGGTMALVVFGLLRLIGISIPAEAWHDATKFPDLPQILQTVQQVTASLNLGDLPTILAGSIVNMPALGLGILAATSFLLSLQTLPQIGVGDDLVTGRALAMYTVTILCTAGSVLLTPFPWNLATGALALFLLCSVLMVSTIPWQLGRWLRFARRLQLSGQADAASSVADEHEGHQPTLGEGAKDLERLVTKLRKRAWKKRDKAFTKSFQRSYFTARLLRILLGIEARAAARNRPLSGFHVRMRISTDSVIFAIRGIVLRALPFATVVAAIALALAPTPWIAPTCLTHAGDSTTVYVLPNNPTPAYLDDATRTVTHTSWDGAELSVGTCA